LFAARSTKNAKNAEKLAKILSVAALCAVALAGCSSDSPTTSPDVSELVITELEDGKSVELGTTSVLRVHGVQARYVRMYSRRRNTGYGNSLWELEVYGDNTTCTP